MAIPGNVWLYDDGGALIKGGCDVADREFSIEFNRFHHNLSIPTDNATGKPTGTLQHSPMIIVKEFGYSSSYFYGGLN
ncbi:type VI secretion system tube protein Hcp [Escherichia coli]|nr:type VI secretion system tube protein Hcp [Escherichia coli]